MVSGHRLMREAWPVLVVISSAALVVHYTFSFSSALPVWMLALGFAWLHRDPQREIPIEPLAIVAPVDGRVSAVEQTDDPFLKRSAIKISIRKSFINVFQLRSPVEGKVQKIKVVTESQSLRTSDNFVPYIICIQTDEHDDVVLVAEGARFMRRPRIYIQAGQRVGLGQRLGYVPFGNQFTVYIPVDARLISKTGESILGGASIMAKFTHK